MRSEAATQGFFGRILVDPTDGEHVMATEDRAGVVESMDGGRTWRRLGASPAAPWLSRAGPGSRH